MEVVADKSGREWVQTGRNSVNYATPNCELDLEAIFTRTVSSVCGKWFAADKMVL